MSAELSLGCSTLPSPPPHTPCCFVAPLRGTPLAAVSHLYLILYSTSHTITFPPLLPVPLSATPSLPRQSVTDAPFAVLLTPALSKCVLVSSEDATEILIGSSPGVPPQLLRHQGCSPASPQPLFFLMSQ